MRTEGCKGGDKSILCNRFGMLKSEEKIRVKRAEHGLSKGFEGKLQVVMMIPLKQGLKLCTTGFRAVLFNRRCYDDSIKTRIETSGSDPVRGQGGGVVMMIPLKQGLKHSL